MSPWCYIAQALSDQRANAAGSIRLRCGAKGLSIELVEVVRYTPGYLAGEVVRGRTIDVPYSAIQFAACEGRKLILQFEPAQVSPFNRFVLAQFSAMQVVAGLSDAVASAPAQSEQGARVAAASSSRGPLSLPPVRTSHARDRFVAELRSRAIDVVELDGHAPSSNSFLSTQGPSVGSGAASDAGGMWRRHAWLAQGRWRALLRSGLAAMCIASAVAASALTLEYYAFRRGAKQAVRPVGPGLQEMVASTVARPWPLVPTATPCHCDRAQLPLWEKDIPVLTVLFANAVDDGSGVPLIKKDKHGYKHYAFDVAVVNNSATPLRELRVQLAFYTRDKQGKKIDARERGLFWGPPLNPGESVKWDAEAFAGELKITNHQPWTLKEKGIQAAPADAFVPLTTAKLRIVRLHGAEMLAYHRDPRAKAVVDALIAEKPMDALGPSERARLEWLRRAVEPVVACEVNSGAGPDRWSICLDSAGTTSRVANVLAEQSDALGNLKTVRTWDGGFEMPAGEGRRVELPCYGCSKDVVISAR
jgi:hypothetical protein